MCYILSIIGYKIWLDGWFLNVVIAYIVGMICSRFSSVCIESLFKKYKWIQWRDYELYNKAKKERPYIATLLENANMYRTFVAVFFLAFVAIGCKELEGCWAFFPKIEPFILLLALLLLFVFSYIKQTNEYVIKNIDEVNKQSN